MSTKSSSEKLREKTLLKHLQKRRKRKIPLLRGVYHNKMLKILVMLVCLVNILYHLNIIQFAVSAANDTNSSTFINNTTTLKITNFSTIKSVNITNNNKTSVQSDSRRQKNIRSINVNSSYNHQNEIVQRKPENLLQTTKRKLRRKPIAKGNHTRSNTGSNRYKGKRRKYNRPTWRVPVQQNNTNIYKPKNYTTLRTTASTTVTTSTSRNQPYPSPQQHPFMTQQQQQFSYTNRSFQRQHQYQQQSVQIPSSTIRVSSTIDHHQNYDNSSRYYPTTNIQHFIGLNTSNYPQQNVVIQGNTDIVVYRNIGPIPCPPGVRLVPHRVITATPDPRMNRQRECQCSPVGSISNTCDKRSGQCHCLANVTGRRCDKCKSGHWNLTQNVGCHDCRCDLAGARSHECNPWTGQCDCKIGVGGQRCNECTDGFFGFSTEGCQRCAACPGEGQVCDPINGRCVCPPMSRGLGCSQCVTGTWGWQPRLGCRECECDRVGSIGQYCHTATGQCQCREGYAGRQCNSCSAGYFGYPECRRCNCDVEGSYVSKEGLITCDANGQCPCKSLVVGLKCDTCMQSTFGLSALNPEGCTRCYCFGRAAECEQSDWSWGHVRMSESRNLTVQYLGSQHVTTNEFEYIVVIQMLGSKTYREDAEIQNINGLNLIPRSTGNVTMGSYTQLYYPLYYQLPPQFYGDRTSSYGGNLYFTLLTEGGTTPLDRKILSRYPLVQLHAHSKMILDFYEYESFEYSRNETYRVPLHESYWKLHHNGQTVDRGTLMAALQNVRHIFIRGSCFADFTEVILQNVHMDSAIYVHGSTSMIAKGVEKCKCPKRFDGLSCQDPGRGFYRWRNITETETIYIEDLIGRAAACFCNGRSQECDRETGECVNCRENSGGRHCEQCAEGFFGDPNSPYGCQACPCPETNRNFAKGCTVWQGEVSCVCRPGYTGKLCDKCRHGFYGNPLASPVSTCKPCDCNLNGITKEGCDAQTGQCYCREGVTGLKCDKCKVPRHHVEEKGCKICDNCTLLLLDYVELISYKLRRGIHNMDLTGIPAPYIKVEEYEEMFNMQNVRYHDFNNARKLLLNYDGNALLKLDSHAENQKFQNRKALSTGEKRNHAVGIILNDATLLYVDLESVKAGILENIANLENYGHGSHHLSLPTALQQAQFYLESIKQHRDSVNDIRTAASCAWHYFYKFGNASDMGFDQKAKVEMFWRDLNHTNFRISDIRLQADRTVEMQSEIDDVLEHIRNLKSYVGEDYIQIVDLKGRIEEYLKQTLVPQTAVLVEMNVGRLELLSGNVDNIIKLGTVLNATLDENETVHREVRKHWLPKAQKHAARLLERSNEYARQFQPTRNGARIAMLASSAHKNISDAIEQARLASAEARERVYAAHNKLYPRQGMSVIERANISLEKSKILKQDAMQEIYDTEALKSRLKFHENKVEGIKTRIINAGIRTNNISSHIQPLQHTTARKNTLESLDSASKVSEEMRGLSRRTQLLHEDIKKLRDKFNILEPDWEIKLGMAEENISLTKTNVRLANISLTYVEEQAIKEQSEFDEWNKTMAKQIEELRNKIAKAKHAAEGIKISLESLGPKCMRSYLPTSYGLTTLK